MPTDVGDYSTGGLEPGDLTAVGNTLFFLGRTTDGQQLWTSDGTVTGTVQVTDINASDGGLTANDLNGRRKRLRFRRSGFSQRWLPRSGGRTAGGTEAVTDPKTSRTLPAASSRSTNWRTSRVLSSSRRTRRTAAGHRSWRPVCAERARRRGHAAHHGLQRGFGLEPGEMTADEIPSCSLATTGQTASSSGRATAGQVPPWSPTSMPTVHTPACPRTT